MSEPPGMSSGDPLRGGGGPQIPPPTPPPPKPEPQMSKRETAIGCLALVVAGIVGLVILAAIFGSDEPEEQAATTTPTATATATPTTTPDETATATPTEEPEDTATPQPSESDRAIVRARRFYERMDDLAIHLDTAIGDQLDGKPGALDRIKRFRTQIRDRLNKHLLAGGDMSIGANLLLSAATQAREAAIDENLPRLVDARREIVDARDKLAEEIVG